MANVTYLIGAGASAGKRDKGNVIEGLPCVNEIPLRINNIITLLRNTPIPRNITWQNSQLGLNSKEDWDKAREVLLNQFQELYQYCTENATIDTYAKKLVLKREIDKFKHFLTYHPDESTLTFVCRHTPAFHNLTAPNPANFFAWF